LASGPRTPAGTAASTPAADPVALALCARDVSVELGHAAVLSGVTFQARFGEMLAVLGPNGAGKTTLLRALAGLIPHRGTIEVAGSALHTLERREAARRIAFVPQRTQLSVRMSVEAVVSQGRYAHRGGIARLTAADHAAIERAMARADVLPLRARELPDLSYGEQRRVLLARALATEARVLLLDEPTAALDVAHALQLYVVLRELTAAGHCIVLVVHQLDDALRHADSALLIDGGRQVALGSSSDVIRSQHIERVYGVALVEAGALGFRLLAEPA
jgi:iron complex transport system ATP-binding protein